VALVGWLWYLVTLLPVIGLVQVGEQARADRFTYVPEIGSRSSRRGEGARSFRASCVPSPRRRCSSS
jgi:hypothetical protein